MERDVTEISRDGREERMEGPGDTKGIRLVFVVANRLNWTPVPLDSCTDNDGAKLAGGRPRCGS